MSINERFEGTERRLRLLHCAFAICMVVVLPGVAPGQTQTIAATETIGWFCSDGKMKETAPQFAATYLLEAEQVVRTSVYDLKAKKLIPDDTKYRVIELASHAPAILKGGPIEDSFFPPVVRAVGFPGTDAVEILTIGKDFIQSVKSTSTYYVISYSKREK